MLDSTASEEVVHRRSDSVGSGSTTSGLESLLGSGDTHGRESAPRVGSKPAGISHNATSSRSKAGRGRHASNSWGWASVISFILLLLFIAGIRLVGIADRQSLSVGMQKSIDLASQAWLGAGTASAWMMYTGGQLYQRVPPLQAPRHSSREEIGSGLGETYTGLSQALVARNLLHDAPELLRQKRGQAMRFRLPEDSLISNDLRLFLQLTQDADEDMLEMIFRIYQVATLALRQQSLTQETLGSIQQHVQYWSTFGPFATFEWLRIYFTGISTQEAELRTRLKDHVELMYEKIIAADASTHRVLQRFHNLAFTTENIRESCLQEEQRLLSIKGVMASHINWLMRAAMQYGIVPASEEIAKISRNVELADDIHEWSKGIVKLLEHITIHLKYAKVQMGSLMEILRAGGTIKWTEDTKNAEFMEFLAQIAEGFALLMDNSAAWDQLQLSGQI